MNAQPYIVLNDAHGRYIPQLFCEDIAESDCPSMGIKWSDVQTCIAGPDHEWYWEAWQTIENNFEQADDKGIKWYLYQNGDLWCYPEGYQFPEDF
jgi:hypothetical protein